MDFTITSKLPNKIFRTFVSSCDVNCTIVLTAIDVSLLRLSLINIVRGYGQCQYGFDTNILIIVIIKMLHHRSERQ